MSWLGVLGKGLEALAKFLPFIGVYRAGKKSEKLKQLRSERNAVIKAKKIRESLLDGDVVNRLHNKYKR
jgi:hypothetical protein